LDETMTIMLTRDSGSPPEAMEVPRRVGSVKLGEKLGEGASGVVFQGYDEALDRKVAVKVLHRRDGKSFGSTFAELADGVRTAARIKHPNIVTVFSVETAGDLPIIVMEFVDGISLRELLTRGGVPDLPLALHLCRTITGAVAALHEANVLHRDLKPANVLIDVDGRVYVCDFGLACTFSPSRYSGDATNIAGSPLYMAPEMFDGEVSPQSDVYALGMLLFEVLTGAPPFAADSMSRIRRCHEVERPPTHLLHARGVPEELVDVVERALHKRRFLRYKTAGHLLRAIESVDVPSPPDDTLRRVLVDRVAARGGVARDAASAAAPPVAMTTFDLVARKAREKRGQ